MEIELPDGTILDAPDDADVKKVVRGYHRQLLMKKNPAEYDPSSPEFAARYDPTAQGTKKVAVRGVGLVEVPVEDTFREGIGRSLSQAGKGAVNLGVKGVNLILPQEQAQLSDLIAPKDRRRIKGPAFASDEAIQESDKLDQPLLRTGGGMAGDLVGGLAATAPLGTMLKVVQLAKTAPLLLRALTTGGRVGTEGALNAALFADPEHQKEAAKMGGGLSLALDALLRGGSRAVTGLVKKSGATEDLEHLAEQHGKKIFVPVGQAADAEGDLLTRGTRSLYREALPYAPLVTGKIRSQEAKALETVRELAAEEANVTGQSLGKGAGRDLLQTRRTLKRAFDSEYQNTVKSYAFNVPKDFRDKVVARIKAAMPNVDNATLNKVADALDEKMARFSSGAKVMEGENLLNAKNSSNRLYSKFEDPVERKAVSEGVKAYDDLIENELSQGGSLQNLEDLARYKDLSEPYSSFSQFSKAVGSAKPNRGQFTPAQLAAASKDPGTMLHLATTAQEVLGKTSASPSVAGRALVYGAGAFGALSNAPAVIALIGGANILSTKTVQRALMGDIAAQRALAAALKANPEVASKLSSLLRAGSAQQAVQ